MNTLTSRQEVKDLWIPTEKKVIPQVRTQIKGEKILFLPTCKKDARVCGLENICIFLLCWELLNASNVPKIMKNDLLTLFILDMINVQKFRTL